MSGRLRRFWFPAQGHLGIGVSAMTREEAGLLAERAAKDLGWDVDGTQVVEDVDIRDLDQEHVIPNMGPPSFRGVWYPCRNL
jgi:hypothetical protein